MLIEPEDKYSGKELKMYYVILEYLKNPQKSIDELVEILDRKGIKTSSSSVQRYLNDEEFIDREFGNDLSKDIKTALAIRKRQGNINGGMESTKNNVPTKDSYGHFTGSVKSYNEDRRSAKLYHCKVFGTLLLNNPNMSLNDVAVLCNAQKLSSKCITRDYIYDCLQSSDMEMLFTENEIAFIRAQLKSRSFRNV